jgi:hypothetical protein
MKAGQGVPDHPGVARGTVCLIEVDIAHGRCSVGAFLGALEELVEFLLEHFAVRFLRFDLLLEDLVAPRFDAFQLDHFGRQVLNQLGPLGNGVGDDGARFGIDPESGLAAGAVHIEHSFGHATMVRDGVGPGAVPGAEERRL